MTEHANHTGLGAKEVFSTLQFLVMAAIVFFAGRKMIVEMLKLRAENISKKIVDAKLELERIQFEAQKAKKEISEMHSTKQRMIEEVRLQGQKFYDQLVIEAKETASRILADSKLAAQNEVTQATLRLKQEIVNQAVTTALKIAETQESRVVLHRGLVEQLSDVSGSTKEGHHGVS
jgi:F0F1-type ATP synthase membrane subunit b/b'